jgi:hypothetical protein
MSPLTVQWPQVQAHIDRIRSTNSARAHTNCFAPLTGNANLSIITSESAVVFTQAETEFSRIYYCASSAAALGQLLTELHSSSPLVIGYLDRIKNETLCEVFRQTGFVETAHYLRMTIPTFPIPKDAEPPEFPNVDETDAVMGLLRLNFSRVTDFLPSREQISTLIEQRQIIVRREERKITGLVVFLVQGRQVNLNYLLNRGRRGDGSLLMQSFFFCMAERGLNSGFLWVNGTNERALKIYIANGWKADGLNDWFFIRNSA